MRAFWLLLALPWLAHSAAPPLAAGKGSFVFQDAAVNAGRPITVWYYEPADLGPDSDVLFVMHGVNRDAGRYLDEWIEVAKRHRAVLLCPEFSATDWPEDINYNLGNVFQTIDESGRAAGLQSEARWSFSLLDPIFDSVVARLSLQARGYLLYGHSAGAQFVHRLLFFRPDTKVKRAVSANAGWYMLPDPTVPFPYGLKGTPVREAAVRKALGMPLTILLGEEDVDPNNKWLRRSPGAMQQGPNRFARGQYYFAEAQRAARGLGTAFGWRLVTAPGVAHHDKQMVPYAERALFP
jgi:poly(3-hydroxybutyrate) depolymerase